jgi:SMI1/KNR4 family protein SUKH-1
VALSFRGCVPVARKFTLGSRRLVVMTADDLDEIEVIRQKAMRLGIVLPEARRAVPTIGCFGHKLPHSFVWFCRHYPKDRNDWYPPMGLLSPFGQPSDLKRHNEAVRKWDRRWPSHWISFWHGNDGDYCFSYDTNGHPWIVYWEYNAPDQFEHLQFEDAYEAVSFAEWYVG